MKKIIILSIILCLAMFCSASALVLTDEEAQEIMMQQEQSVTRASDYFASRWVWASAGADGEIEFGFDVTCARRMNHLGAIKIEVMRKSGNNWISVETYENTDSGMGYLYQSNRATVSEAVYFDGTSGKDYFAYVTVKAEDDDGSEKIIMSTNVVTAN